MNTYTPTVHNIQCLQKKVLAHEEAMVEAIKIIGQVLSDEEDLTSRNRELLLEALQMLENG